MVVQHRRSWLSTVSPSTPMHHFTLFYKCFLKTWHSAITTPSQCPPTWNSWWNIPQRSFRKRRSVEPAGFVLLQPFLLRPSSSVILVSLVLNLLWAKKCDFKIILCICSLSWWPSHWGCLGGATPNTPLCPLAPWLSRSLGALSPSLTFSSSVSGMPFLFLTHLSNQTAKVL